MQMGLDGSGQFFSNPFLHLPPVAACDAHFPAYLRVCGTVHVESDKVQFLFCEGLLEFMDPSYAGRISFYSGWHLILAVVVFLLTPGSCNHICETGHHTKVDV